jgi:hypothetical protein
MRRRLGEPFSTWDARHFSKSLLSGLEGDVRVAGDTIMVAYYNAPHAERLRQHYQGRPERLTAEKIAPTVSLAVGVQTGFRFR